MTEVIAGIVALVIAIGFLGVLVYKVASVPLWIVILLGAAMMVASFLESARGDETR
jgi:hypothetical protein